MKSVFGPVSSWRLGCSLGIDPICSKVRICSFDCTYCQMRGGEKTCERREYINMDKFKEDIKLIANVKADVITFSGTGEPTLAKNLGEMIDYVRSISNLPVGILTNSSFLLYGEVRNILYKLDFVVAKLDVPNEKLFMEINRPHKNLSFQKYLEGIKTFRKKYKGKFALQIMFIKSNKAYASDIAKLAKEFEPDEVQINTPLRNCSVQPLNKEEIKEIKQVFSDFNNVISVYEATKPNVEPIDIEEVRKRKRFES